MDPEAGTMTDDLTDAEQAVRRALSDPRLLREMARETRAEWARRREKEERDLSRSDRRR